MVNNVFLRNFRILICFSGKTSGIKCKREADAPKLTDFVAVLRDFISYHSKQIKIIKIVTDDTAISQEIKTLKNVDFKISEPVPAPKRIIDKVY